MTEYVTPRAIAKAIFDNGLSGGLVTYDDATQQREAGRNSLAAMRVAEAERQAAAVVAVLDEAGVPVRHPAHPDQGRLAL